jgi:hypothetical protein
MTTSKYHRRATYAFVAWFAILTVAADGLHGIPGWGHLVQLPDGSVVGYGVAGPGESPPACPVPAGLRARHDAPCELLGAETCPICSFVAKAKNLATPANWQPPTCQFQLRWMARSLEPAAGTVPLFLIRAPPLG